MVWYAARSRNRRLRRRFRRWLRKPRNRAIYRRRSRRPIRFKRRGARRSRYNGIVRYKFSASEDVTIGANGIFLARAFDLTNVSPSADIYGPNSFITGLCNAYRMYRIRKVKVEFAPCQTQAFSTAQSGLPDTYTGPKIDWYSGILNWGGGTVYTPSSLKACLNAGYKRKHSSLSRAKHVFTPAVISNAANPTIRRVFRPWLSTNNNFNDMTVTHQGIWMCWPGWDALLPGDGIFAGEGTLYYRITYTIYVEFKYLFMDNS